MKKFSFSLTSFLLLSLLILAVGAPVLADTLWSGSTGSDIYNANSGRVYVGSGTPTHKFNVFGSIKGTSDLFLGSSYTKDGDIQLIGTSGNKFVHIDASGTTPIDGNIKLYLSGSGDSFFKGGNLGIGTDNPSESLEVDGRIKNNNTVQFASGWYSDTSPSIRVGDEQYGISAKTGYLRLWSKASSGGILFNTNSSEAMRITSSGEVGIGTITPSHKLTVNGTIKAEEIIVGNVTADYVFKDDYYLRPLEDVESFINKNGYLPNIPNEKEVEINGLQIGELNVKLLEKIEELTLYIIDLEKRIQELESK